MHGSVCGCVFSWRCVNIEIVWLRWPDDLPWFHADFLYVSLGHWCCRIYMRKVVRLTPFLVSLSLSTLPTSLSTPIPFPSFSRVHSSDSHRPVQQYHRDCGCRLVQGHHRPGSYSDRSEQQVPPLPGPHEMWQGNEARLIMSAAVLFVWYAPKRCFWRYAVRCSI